MLIPLVNFDLLVLVRQPIEKPECAEMGSCPVGRAMHQPDRCIFSVRLK
jgi:hypothetical protein